MRRAHDMHAAPILEAHQAAIDCKLAASTGSLRFLHAHTGGTLHLVGEREPVDEFYGALEGQTVPYQIPDRSCVDRADVHSFDALYHVTIYTR